MKDDAPGHFFSRPLAFLQQISVDGLALQYQTQSLIGRLLSVMALPKLLLKKRFGGLGK